MTVMYFLMYPSPCLVSPDNLLACSQPVSDSHNTLPLPPHVLTGGNLHTHVHTHLRVTHVTLTHNLPILTFLYALF